MDAIRVMVADDDEFMRTMLSALITTEPELQLAGTASDTGEAIQVAADTKPDVVLLDLDMPGGGFKAAEQIAGQSARTQVIALTSLDTPEAELEVMRAGAVSFLVKGTPNEEILEAIRSAVRWRPGQDGATGDGPPQAASGAAGPSLEQRVAALEQAVVRALGGRQA